ncbi:MAG: HTH-type transcriptional activator IlvY [Spirochaetales bacterium]|nr:HTH-type transcriptional activator IlvY [Spirochaetales bacterium]MCF7939105.1 HTH-type transcriptional activator IlvY [Spirochaetales bacterium]
MIIDEYYLDLFLTLAGTLHFGRAGRIANISPSALSRAVQRMEEEVGEKLFERDNRSVRLTRAGEHFQQYALEARARWREFREGLAEEAETLTGSLGVYSSVTAAYSVLPEIVRRFREAYPDVHLNLQTGEAAGAVDSVRNGEADIAVSARPDHLPKDLEFLDLTGTPLRFILPRIACGVRDRVISGGGEVLSDREVSGDRLGPEQFNGVPFVLPRRGLARRRIDAWFREHSVDAGIYAEVAGNEAILSMVSLGCGVGVVPELVIEKSPLMDEVELLEVRPGLEPYRLGLVCRSSRSGAAVVAAFWRIAALVFGGKPGGSGGFAGGAEGAGGAGSAGCAGSGGGAGGAGGAGSGGPAGPEG